MITDDIENFDSPQARREMNRRHAAVAKMMVALAAQGLAELEQKAAAGQPLNMTPEEIRNFYELGDRLLREAKESDDRDTVPAKPRKPS